VAGRRVGRGGDWSGLDLGKRRVKVDDETRDAIWAGLVKRKVGEAEVGDDGHLNVNLRLGSNRGG